MVRWQAALRAKEVRTGVESVLKAPSVDKRRADRYEIPQGSWFEWVSCAHYLAEIVRFLCSSRLLLLQKIIRHIKASKHLDVYLILHPYASCSCYTHWRHSAVMAAIISFLHMFSFYVLCCVREQVLYAGIVIASDGNNLNIWLLYLWVVCTLPIYSDESFVERDPIVAFVYTYVTLNFFSSLVAVYNLDSFDRIAWMILTESVMHTRNCNQYKKSSTNFACEICEVGGLGNRSQHDLTAALAALCLV